MIQNTASPLEVLAPAGSLEHVEAAIAAGADAFYVGLKGLGARPNPWNLDLDEIETATSLAHSSGRRIHVAVNAEFHTRQDAYVREAIARMSAVDVDALIVGDFGLLYFLKQIGNPIPNHASTLLGIYNPEGMRFLNQLYGVTRLVLNTGLFLDEIIALHFHCPEIELELIAYGGVCFNDNRRCRQPHYLFEGEYCVGCKQLYEVYPTQEAVIPLSEVSKVASQVRPPDMPIGGERLIWSPEVDLTGQIGLFARAGIVSFKIEGRTRAVDYVTMSTSKMRAAVDRLKTDAAYQDPELAPYYYLGHHAVLHS
jgi:putative protease